jgi:ATP-binding cassette, subfamily B, bacterial
MGDRPQRLVDRFPALGRLRLEGRRRRVPFVQQVTPSDCGAACLAMVLAYHGKHLRLDDVRAVTGFGRDGADALSLLKAGRWFGLRGRGLKVENLDDLRFVEPGSILHWEFNHFVVLSGFHKKGLLVIDPGAGPRLVGREELERAFTGVVLTFQPSEQFETSGGDRFALWRYAHRILAGHGVLSRVAVTSLLIQVFALAVPFLVGVLVDRVVPRGDASLLTVLAAGLGVIVVFHLAATLLRSYLLLQMRTQLDAQMTLDFLDHLVALPYSFFQKRSAGDLMMRLNSNATIREILTSSVLSGLLDGALVSIYLLLLFATSFEIGMLVVALGSLRLGLFALTRRRHRELMSHLLQVQAKSQSYQVQLLAGMQTLKSSGAEQRAVERWSNLFVDELNVSLARGRLDAFVDSSLAVLGLASPIAVLLYGTVQVLQGDLSLGTMLALNALAVGFLVPLSQLIATAFRLQLLGSYLERIRDVLDTPREQAPGKGVLPGRLTGAVRLDQVSFQYAPLAPLVVREVSVEVEPGRFVALVGRSGAGKSTLAHLLVGLYLPTSGTILYDGINLVELDLQATRSQVGVVSQHPYIFGGTVRANIAMNDPTLSYNRIVEAARLAQIDEDILAMPMGYDTLVSDGGSSLSGGQRQRLALARALALRPSMLLLDEATSMLDAITERGIHEALGTLHCTRIVIAHRLSTVRNADLILVMHEGRIVERGTHDELMNLGGRYNDLVAHQLERQRLRRAM